ncbi:MAG: PaaI family thioesterase [Ruminococcaceae bacterium]|nr:PaaI family thioesterase [Oscillospiraceae bacterium]
MQKLNPEHVKYAIDFANQVSCMELLSIRLTDITVGGCQVEMGVEQKHLNPYNLVYGGVYSAMVDFTTYWAVYGEMPETAGYTTLDLHVDDLASTGLGGMIYAEGRSIKIGRSVCLAECFIRDEGGKLLVHGTSKLMVTPTIPPNDEMVAGWGFKQPPPKFLEA